MNPKEVIINPIIIINIRVCLTYLNNINNPNAMTSKKMIPTIDVSKVISLTIPLESNCYFLRYSDVVYINSYWKA